MIASRSGERRARKAVKSEAALGRARVRATLDSEHAVLLFSAKGNHVFGSPSILEAPPDGARPNRCRAPLFWLDKSRIGERKHDPRARAAFRS